MRSGRTPRYGCAGDIAPRLELRASLEELMVITAFPPLDYADETGLLAVGGDLEVESLLLAYSSGIFPWPIVDDDTLTWFSPPERCLLFLDELHVPKSLEKERRRSAFTFRFNSAFSEVVQACAKSRNRVGQEGTWITTQMIEAYIRLHEHGYAHSVECYDAGRLVGGLYGVAIGSMFAGESLFYRTSNASKLCLWCVADYLRTRGVRWIDCQQQTPLLEGFGAREIAREEFVKLLEQAVVQDVRLFAPHEQPPAAWGKQ